MQKIKKIREWTYQHAIPAAFIVFAFIEVLLPVIGKLFALLPQNLPIKYVKEIVLIVIPIAIVFFFGFSRTFKKGNFFKGILYSLPFILLQVLVLINHLKNPEASWNPWYLILYEVFSIIGVGIREECIYRATIQNIIAKKHANSVKGIWTTVIISAIIFGLCHVSNVFFGAAPLAVLSQVITAIFVGLMFGAIYLRSGSIWALIFVHSFTDLAGFSNSIFLSNSSTINDINNLSFSISSLIFYSLFVGITIFLLRPSKCKQIYENLCFADKNLEADKLS